MPRICNKAILVRPYGGAGGEHKYWVVVLSKHGTEHIGYSINTRYREKSAVLQIDSPIIERPHYRGTRIPELEKHAETLRKNTVLVF